MDHRTLLHACTQACSADSAAREEAEQRLQSLEGVEGLFPLLCQIALSDCPLEVRLSAVLFLKNSCKDWQSTKQRPRPIPDSDQLYLRTHIVSFLLPSVTDKLRLQFEEIAKSMAESLFPAQWQEAYGLLDSSILTGNSEQLYAGLTLFHMLLKAFERNSAEHKSDLQVLITRYFGRLQQVWLQLPLEEANFPLFVLILKVYHMVTYINFGEITCIDTWIGKIKDLLDAPLNLLERQPETAESAKRLEEHPAWVCKRYCAQIMQRTAHFRAQFTPQLTAVALNLLLNRPTRWVPDTVAVYLWKIITQGAKAKDTREEIHRQVLPLLESVLLAQVCRVPLDEELWAQNPVEFIRRENDIVHALYSAKAAAVDFLIAVCGETPMLQSVLSYLEQQFQADSLAPHHKEALLLLFGSLAELLAKEDSLSGRIEVNLKSFVYPDLTSPYGFLRARAVSVYGMCASAPILQTDHQEKALQQVCRLLDQSELPVQIEAAITLSKILTWPRAKHVIEPEIKAILSVYLGIMKLIDSEELMNSMETLVREFQSAVLPYSVELTRELTQAFQRIVAGNPENVGNIALAAASTLNTLAKVIETVKTQPEKLIEVSSLLLPVFQFTLSPQGADFLEEGISLLEDLLCCPRPGSLPQLFSVFPLLLEALVGSEQSPPYLHDHIELLFSPLAHFISQYSLQFLSCSGFTRVLQACHRLLSLSEETVGFEHHLAVKLLLCLLENYPKDMQVHLRDLRTVAFSLLKRQKKARKLLGIELFAMISYVNPQFSIQDSSPNSQEFLFSTWVQLSPSFNSESGKLHSACGLLRLVMTYSDQSLNIRQHLPLLFKQLIRTLHDLKSMEGTVIEEDLQDVIGKLKVKTREEEQDGEEVEEEDDWSPIDEDRYESPITLQGLLKSLKRLIPQLQEARQFEALCGLFESRDWEELSSLHADNS